MSSIQIYYVCPDRLKKNLLKQGIDLDISIRTGDKSLDQVYNEIKNDTYFCRDEVSINFKHFLGIIRNDITLYANLDDKIGGVLNFTFNEKDGERIIHFNGICSPIKYSGEGVGQELINTLIRIGKQNDIKYIYIECKGNIMKYYHDKFGFEIINTQTSYDSDDEEDSTPYYYMRLDLSKVSGGNKKNVLKKTNKRRKRRSVTIRKRKLRK
jgi:hypothetical protein